MIIYRVERVDTPRAGPWKSVDHDDRRPIGHPQLAKIAARLGVINPNHHPTPWDEGLWFGRRHHCGLPHLDAYRTWFAHPELRAAIYADGRYHMRVYDVPDELVIKGMLQVMFDPDDATSVRVATPEEIL